MFLCEQYGVVKSGVVDCFLMSHGMPGLFGGFSFWGGGVVKKTKQYGVVWHKVERSVDYKRSNYSGWGDRKPTTQGGGTEIKTGAIGRNMETAVFIWWPYSWARWVGNGKIQGKESAQRAGMQASDKPWGLQDLLQTESRLIKERDKYPGVGYLGQCLLGIWPLRTLT